MCEFVVIDQERVEIERKKTCGLKVIQADIEVGYNLFAATRLAWLCAYI